MKKIACFIGIVFGIIAIILSFTVRDLDNGSYESNKSYGGDAYTGIQNAAAQAANNVQDGNDIIMAGFGNVLLIMGGATVAYFLKELADTMPATTDGKLFGSWFADDDDEDDDDEGDDDAQSPAADAPKANTDPYNNIPPYNPGN